jgi:hypothetical protein
MIICHHLGEGGWEGAERHVRFGLDYLEHLDHMEEVAGLNRTYSIVRIGTGRVGTRDGADHMCLHQAMADSHLILDLYVYERPQLAEDVSAKIVPLRPFRAWSPNFGEEAIPLSIAA